MDTKKIRTLVISACFSALCCVATMVIQIPSPMNGYVNLGDCFVLLAGWILGPFYGLFAAGIGSCLADILTGYVYYAPATFLIKGLMAMICAYICQNKGASVGKRVASGIVAEIVMIAGYFLFAAVFLGNGLAAAASIPGNVIQGIVGVAAAAVLYAMIGKTKIIGRM